MKTKKLVKNALKHPELYGPAELAFFRRWLDSKKRAKAAKINKDKRENSYCRWTRNPDSKKLLTPTLKRMVGRQLTLELLRPIWRR